MFPKTVDFLLDLLGYGPVDEPANDPFARYDEAPFEQGVYYAPMPEYLSRAPSREDNLAGPRQFGYIAELDLVGWKFVTNADGSFVIETPQVPDFGSLFFTGSAPTRRLLLALLSQPDDSEDLVSVPSEAFDNVGYVG